MVKRIIIAIIFMLLCTVSQKNYEINTKGYYIAIYHSNIGENDLFEETAIILLKFDNDGYCNVFDIPITKGNKLEDEIINIKNRIYTENSVNSGFYTINKDKITIKYGIFNNSNHLLGKYISIYYRGTIINDNKIQLQTNHGHNLEFRFIEDRNVKFRNYFRENKK